MYRDLYLPIPPTLYSIRTNKLLSNFINHSQIVRNEDKIKESTNLIRHSFRLKTDKAIYTLN